MRPGTYSTDGFQLPPLLPWMRNLLLGLFLLYVVEIIARNFMGVPLDHLSWSPLGPGFHWWQLLTHFLVQGAGRAGAISTLFGLLVLYFFLPTLTQLMARNALIEGVGAGIVGGVVVGLAGDMALGMMGSLHYGGATGWAPIPAAMVILFGLAMPEGTIRLFFVLPIKGIWIVWGSIFLGALFVVAEPSVDTLEFLGAVLGPLGWWQWRGPGGRRRRLKAKAASIERELSRFTVLDGGKDDDDDWVH